MLKYTLFLLCFYAGVLVGQVGWQHPSSPWRAVFDIKGKVPDMCGVLLDIPACGLSAENGGDVVCYNEQGRQLVVRSLGRGNPTNVYVLVQSEGNTRQIYAYFGSRQITDKGKLRTPVISEVRLLPKGGLTCKSAKQAEALVERSTFLGQVVTDSVVHVCNPITSSRRFVMVTEGRLNIPSTTTLSLFIATEGSGYLWVDGKLLIERNMPANRWSSMTGQNHKEIELKAGVHPFKLVAFPNAASGAFLSALGRCYLNGGKVNRVVMMGGSDIVQYGKSTLVRVEGRQKGQSNPMFTYKHLAYMELENDISLTETEFETLSKEPAEWRFNDGIVLKGAKVRRVFGDTNAFKVQVTVQREKAESYVAFPAMAPPTQLSAASVGHFDRIVKLLKEQGVTRMTDPTELYAILCFLEWRDCHPMQGDVASRFLQCSKDRPEVNETRRALLGIVRGYSRFPSTDKRSRQVIGAYEQLFTMAMPDRDRVGLIEGAIEYALYGLNNDALAEKWLLSDGRSLSESSQLRLAQDLALWRGNTDRAKQCYDALLAKSRLGDYARSSAVQGSAYREKTEAALRNGRLLEAEESLRAWMTVEPMARGNGDAALIRARYLVARGWRQGAEKILKMTIDEGGDNLSNLPDLEYELAEVKAKLGKTAEAKALYARVASRYPNHPLAKTAAGKK